MQLSEFKKQPRGPYLFDTWLWDCKVDTALGSLPVELYCNIDANPTEAMVDRASNLVSFAVANGALLNDIIYGHYRYAEANDRLEYWNVPAGLARSEIMEQVVSIILNVHADLFSSIHVDPRWDPEHKLSLTYEETITEVNDEPFRFENGILTLQ